jgi:hypothetical protein
MIDLETYMEICKLAMEHGKNPGDSMQEELEEIMKSKQDKIKYLGQIDQDKDILKGNLREQGIHKILDLTDKKDKNDNV